MFNRKIINKVAVIAMAAGMTFSTFGTSVAYADASEPQATSFYGASGENKVNKPTAKDRQTVRVLGVDEGATVKAYQLVQATYNNYGLTGYKMVNALKKAYSIKDFENPTNAEITKIAHDISYGNLSGLTVTELKWNATEKSFNANLSAGMFLVLVTSEDKGTVYNPMIISNSYTDANVKTTLGYHTADKFGNAGRANGYSLNGDLHGLLIGTDEKPLYAAHAENATLKPVNVYAKRSGVPFNKYIVNGSATAAEDGLTESASDLKVNGKNATLTKAKEKDSISLPTVTTHKGASGSLVIKAYFSSSKHKGRLKNFDRSRPYARGLHAYYLRWLYRLGVLPRGRKRISPRYGLFVHYSVRDDLLNIQHILYEAKIISRNRIESFDDLYDHVAKLQTEVEELERQIRSRKVLPADKEELKKKLKEKRKELNHCDHITERSLRLDEGLTKEVPQKVQEYTDYFDDSMLVEDGKRFGK